MNVTPAPTTAWLIETHGQIVRPWPLSDSTRAGGSRARFCGCCQQHPLYDCGGVLLCARCDTDENERK